MAKRKRNTVPNGEVATSSVTTKKQKASEPVRATIASTPGSSETIQVITGCYDGVLHGLTATIGPEGKGKKRPVEFADTFLLTAHTKAIRCLAVSPVSNPIPGQRQKVILASGSNDAKINLYDLSAHPPTKKEDNDPLQHLAPRPILENRNNSELGTLEHHEAPVTSLEFPTRSKLMSASEDSTISVTRTRDWALIGSLKAPVPKAEGRPSGDTATHDGTPSGVNDFAVHSSMKLMMSVSKGERRVRPWNLMTGKKAKALSYESELLQQIGESRHASGEGKKLIWGKVEGEDEFAVGFDRDVVVFEMAGEPKCKLMAKPGTKVHQVKYFALAREGEEDAGSESSLLACSTEDGRITFSSTKREHITPVENPKKGAAPGTARTIGHVGGKEAGVVGRIKDFTIIQSEAESDTLYVVAGSSDGEVRVWTISVGELRRRVDAPKEQPVGKLVGSYSTDNRVLCMTAYLMRPDLGGRDANEEEFGDLDEDESSASDDDE